MPNQLAPFNEHRFDQCMLWLSQTHDRFLTQFQLVKLHIMIDAFHVLGHGVPVIGGTIEAWKKGPVAPIAYFRLRHKWTAWERGEEDELFQIKEHSTREGVYCFSPQPGVQIDSGEFSQAEMDAMSQAWEEVINSGRNHFHDEQVFIGRAWKRAFDHSEKMDWNVIIDTYDEMNTTDHSAIKQIIAMGSR